MTPDEARIVAETEARREPAILVVDTRPFVHQLKVRKAKRGDHRKDTTKWLGSSHPQSEGAIMTQETADEMERCPLCKSSNLSAVVAEQIGDEGWRGKIYCEDCYIEFSTSYTEPSAEQAITQMLKQWNARKLLQP